MSVLNSAIVNFKLPHMESIKSRRLLNVFAGEGTLITWPNGIAATWGGIIQVGNIRYLIWLQYASVLGLQIKFSIHTSDVWFLILTAGMIHSFIYKNMALGFDIIWLFVGWRWEHGHSRKVLGYILFSISIVTYSYSGNVSADMMQLAKSHRPNELITVHDFKVMLMEKCLLLFVAQLLKTLQMEIKQPFLNFMGGMKLTDMFIQGDSLKQRTSHTSVPFFIM